MLRKSLPAVPADFRLEPLGVLCSEALAKSMSVLRPNYAVLAGLALATLVLLFSCTMGIK